MLRFLLILILGGLIVMGLLRITRFIGEGARRQRLKREHQSHPENFAKRADVIDIESSADRKSPGSSFDADRPSD